MSIREFFGYLLGYESSSHLAVELLEVYARRIPADRRAAAGTR